MDLSDITTITLNPAIDQTVFVRDLQVGQVNRASESHLQAGGKGVNVATMLSLSGTVAAVTGFIGLANVDIFESHFRKHRLHDHFIRVHGVTRTGIKIVDTQADENTDLNLPGPTIDQAHQDRLLDRLRKIALAGRWFVLAGSLPPGVEPEYVREIIKELRSAGSRIAVDTSGEALRVALDEGVDLAKPNRDELAEYLNADLSNYREAMDAAQELQRSKIPNLVVSMGGEGALFLTPGARLMASAPQAKVVSTVGAGDSLLAGFLKGLMANASPADCARLATVFAWNRLESLTPRLPSHDELEEQMRLISVQPLTAFESKAAQVFN
ncbi:1-phosphofructokinase [Cerasicoccus frondis]|uniref:1-phosphofructokinase n=1 Tax=Cerasicoccus frondis TaxID=490090 RepID=UPI00285286E8|nr:1-phosphofructokinase [Cerasicoccus frondis]